MEETQEAPQNGEKEPSKTDVQFYYNRENRLSKASSQVRGLYEEAPQRKPGFFASLTDSKPKAMLFFSIILICIMVLFLNHIVLPKSVKKLGGNAVTVSAMRYEGASFIVLKKTRNTNAWTGIVDIMVFEAESTGRAPAHQQIVFTDAREEEFRWSLPFETSELLFILHAGKHILRLPVLAQ